MARDSTYSGNQVLGHASDPAEIDPIVPTEGDTGITINDDGTVEISTGTTKESPAFDRFNANLADKLDTGALSTIAGMLIEGVQSDITTRQGFIDNHNKGLDLLGLKIEESTTTRTQKRNVSRIGNPLLLEAVVRFQAQARAEMLPAIGPCKVAQVGGSTEAQDQLAADFESDFNFFLTQIDKGFYPDFDRGLFALGFSGNLFKKIYHDPLKRYPVSRSIQIEDLIVSEDASDLEDAQRVTHRIYLTNAQLKRMQFAGAYRDVSLGMAQSSSDPTKMKQGDIIGIAAVGLRPEDQEHEIYEVYTDLDLGEYGHNEKKAPKGLPLPYIVTVAVHTREVLAIKRNWYDGDDRFMRRRRIVHYGLIPSFGFLCLGYLHLLGNQTKALRAIWRILIDAGMFASFPGGMKAKGVRTDTNEIAPGPGEFVDVDIGPFDDIKSAFMMMPYKELSPLFIQLAELIGQDAQRIGGIPEMEVGEGRTHVPVGTMMSLIEQATQTMASVHKRMHSTMQDELTLLKELFQEDPASLTKMARNPARKWEVSEEFNSLDLVPASDPNVPSQVHRNMLATALVALSQGAPGLYDMPAVHRRVLKSIGISDWQTILQAPQPQGQQPNPEAMAKMAELQLKKQDLDFRQQDTQRKAASELAQNQQDARDQAQSQAMNKAELASKNKIEVMKQQTARMKFAHDFASHREDNAHEDRLAHLEALSAAHAQHRDHTHEVGLAAAEHAHATGENMIDHAQQQTQSATDHAHQLAVEAAKPKPAPTPSPTKKKD